MDGLDPYKVLQVPKNFTMEELRSRFKKMVILHHPDKTQDIKSTPMFQILAACYKMLADEFKKRESDRSHMDLKAQHDSFHHVMKQNTNFDINKFNLERFNQVFESNKLEDFTSIGYDKWMNDPNSFHKDKKNYAIVKYTEPEALIGSKSIASSYQLGIDRVDDFSGDNLSNKSLNFMDYRIAHSTTNLVDHSKVDHRKEYRSVDELKADRSRISHVMNPRDLRVYELKKLKQEQIEQKRMKSLQQQDDIIEKHHNKLHKLLLGFMK